MSKLDPRPENVRTLYSWKELNNRLQANLNHPDPEKRFLVIDLRDFEMNKDDIISEATKQGYKVTVETNENYLRFN